MKKFIKKEFKLTKNEEIYCMNKLNNQLLFFSDNDHMYLYEIMKDKINLIGKRKFEIMLNYYMFNKYPDNKLIMGIYDKYKKVEKIAIYGY